MNLLIRCLIVGSILAGVGPALAQTVASPWVDHERARSRLIAAEADGGLMAFFEIEMPVGWKTYWRNPGDAGGLPPTLDFAKSGNLGGATVLYPAPQRFSDVAGETIGYKDRVVFPVTLQVIDAAKPVTLRLAVHFGVCKDICVPLEATHELTVPPGSVGAADGALREALDRVPRSMATAKADDPKLVRAQVDSYETPSQISFAAMFSGGGAEADLFVEAPDGLYVPMPKRAEVRGDGTVVFEAKIASPAELKQLLGKPLKVTMVNAAGQSETIATIE